MNYKINRVRSLAGGFSAIVQVINLSLLAMSELSGASTQGAKAQQSANIVVFTEGAAAC